jgi:hypothetical protein
MIEWTLDKLQSTVEEICFSQKLVRVDFPDKEPLFTLLHYPTRRITILAGIEEQRTMWRAHRDGFMTEAQMEKLLRERGAWTEDDDALVEEVKEKINKWRSKLKDPDLSDSAKSMALELIPKLEEDLFKAELNKERGMVNTAERRARQAKYDYMLWACTYDPETDELMWPNYLTFYEEVERKNPELKNKLLSEFLRYLVGHTTEEIRYIARSNLWRLDYLIAQKGNLHLFPRSSVELTPDQKNLLWWTGYYQSLYEMMPEDQPDEWVIQDDEALDNYMEDLHKERSKDRAERKAEKQFGAQSAEKMATSLVMYSHPSYHDKDYDKVNKTSSGKTDLTLQDDPNMEGAAFRRSKAISKSKKFVPDNTE